MAASSRHPAQATVQDVHMALQDFVRNRRDTRSQTWLNSVGLELDEAGRRLEVTFPHAFFAEWFRSNLQQPFEAFLQSHFPALESFAYRIPARRHQPRILGGFSYDPRSTFDTFLYNKKNYLAYMSALELSKAGRIASNPFLVLGERGTGKSHLLRAIANTFVQEASQGGVALFSADELNFIARTKVKDPQALREEVDTFEVFILEDIQQLELYPRLQEDLIYVTDHFLENGKQLLFSSAESLRDLDFIDPKLQSRLESGLIVQLKKPDLDVRLEYVQRESAKSELNLSEDQVMSLARRCLDFQSLHRALVRITAHCQLGGGGPPEDKQFSKLLRTEEISGSESPDPQSIAETVSAYFALEQKDLFSERRTKELVLARQIGMYLCRSLLNLSYSQIGAFFGGKDHSTVLYSIKKIKENQKDNCNMKSMLKDLKNRCRHKQTA